MKVWQFAFLLLPLASSPPAKIAAPATIAKASVTNGRLKFHKLRRLAITGDFDGDHRRDTIYQRTFSGLTKREITSGPDPLQNDWGEVVRWFYEQQADVVLTLNQVRPQSLHLGAGQGLYCLLNLGDNNADGKDEIAFVVDKCDYSQVNSCKIFARCQGKWTSLLQFSIHEAAFDFTTPTLPVFTEINGFFREKKRPVASQRLRAGVGGRSSISADEKAGSAAVPVRPSLSRLLAYRPQSLRHVHAQAA